MHSCLFLLSAASANEKTNRYVLCPLWKMSCMDLKASCPPQSNIDTVKSADPSGVAGRVKLLPAITVKISK